MKRLIGFIASGSGFVSLRGVLVFIGLFVIPCWVNAQAGFDDDRVMLQGFYWESYRHGHPEKFPDFGQKTWYTLVKENTDTIRAGHFDLIWLPPPCYAGQYSAGYNPNE